MNYTVVGITVIIIVCLLIGITLFARQESFGIGETCDTYAQKICTQPPNNTPTIYGKCIEKMKLLCHSAKTNPNGPPML